MSSSGERSAAVGEVELCYETFGSDASPPLLLVMGLASQMVLWEDEFCEQLAGRGFFVVRFDNRDVGRSTILRDRPVPSVRQLVFRDTRAACYSLSEMAADAAGLLDHLQLDRAHVVGISMGGMISQLLAIEHPERVRSLVSIMSTTGNRRVGRTDPRLYLRLVRRPERDRDGYARSFYETQRAIGGRRYPPDRVRMRALAERQWDRGIHPAGSMRQLGAIVTTADRTQRLGSIRVPTTVIHGDADPLVALSGGKATAKAIPGSRLVVIPGMAHALPPTLWPQVIDEIHATAARANEGAPRQSAG